MNFKELEKIVKADGWRLDRIQGSHFQYEHPVKRGIVTIPRHSGDVPKEPIAKPAGFAIHRRCRLRPTGADSGV